MGRGKAECVKDRVSVVIGPGFEVLALSLSGFVTQECSCTSSSLCFPIYKRREMYPTLRTALRIK